MEYANSVTLTRVFTQMTELHAQPAIQNVPNALGIQVPVSSAQILHSFSMLRLWHALLNAKVELTKSKMTLDINTVDPQTSM